MGFLDGLGRMLQGKPAFVDPGLKQTEVPPRAPTDAPQATNQTPVDQRGYKIIPVVTLEHCKSHLNRDRVEVSAWATNQSDSEVELDKITLLGTTMQLDRRLSAGQAYEVRLYSGTAPTHDSYHKANLYYKLVSSNDYFQADFTVEYDYQSDGKYLPEQFHPEHPIRDI